MRVYRGYQYSLNGFSALAPGNFDGVHSGHKKLLATLKQRSLDHGLAAAVLTFEPHPREFFMPEQAPARLCALRDKLFLFEQAGVDIVCVCHFDQNFARLSAVDFMQRVLLDCLRTRLLIVGDDFRFGINRTGDFALLEHFGKEQGFQVESLKRVDSEGERVSSSAVRIALSQGDLKRAEQLLGHTYSITGRVIKGDQLGRQLGFATANVRIKHVPLALSGVFAVRVVGISEHVYYGVANLGTRPTVDGVRTLLEVHLFDFDEEIYGARITVCFHHKLRVEKRFDNLDALKEQIAQDANQAREFFGLSV